MATMSALPEAMMSSALLMFMIEPTVHTTAFGNAFLTSAA